MMIVLDDELGKTTPTPATALAGHSFEPPPPFEDTADHLHFSQYDDPATYYPETEEPPPEFAPYEAEHYDVGDGDIVSHDPHLSTDGEALYHFLLSQGAQRLPKLSLHCRGTHSEMRYRTVTQECDGEHETKTESYSETVVDFHFYISLDKYVLPEVTHWSVLDVDPAYRGRLFKEVGNEPRKTKYNECQHHDKWVKCRDARGLPPWISRHEYGAHPPTTTDDVVLRSSKSLRAWADEYCASPKKLKEFVYVKALYGWDLHKLEQAIRTSIRDASFYSGTLTVEFEKSAAKVYIRPDNCLSRMLSIQWLKYLSMILLIYPFIWLFNHFHEKGGGRWEVCGGAYALKVEALGVRQAAGTSGGWYGYIRVHTAYPRQWSDAQTGWVPRS